MGATYQTNPVRGPINAAFFTVMDRYLDSLLRPRKREIFADLPGEVLELGSGVGANFRYLRPGTHVIAIEPNHAMHPGLRRRAQRHEVDLDLRGIVGECLDAGDCTADAVISSLVLCTVKDPAQVVSEVLRVLRPGGRYAFVEHVGAPERTALRKTQAAVRRPWAWFFEGCSCERDLRSTIEDAGFERTDIESYRLRSPFLPFNTQIAGIAVKSDGGAAAPTELASRRSTR